MTSPARSEAGFTLVEVMAAFAVFSIAVTALLHASGENAKAARIAQDRTLAGIVAENRLVARLASPATRAMGVEIGDAVLGGRDWVWEETITRTGGADLRHIRVVVREEGSDHVLAQRIAFVEPR